MGKELAKTSEPKRGGLARSDWTALAATAPTNPTLMLPAEVRVAVGRLWMANAHVMPNSLALCATLRIYMEDDGLEAADVERVCALLLKPARRAAQRGSWDVLADLSALVADVLKSKAAREECEARRVEGATAVGVVGGADLFKL